MSVKKNTSGFAAIGYSAPIDGLRAVAVLSVMIYHAFAPALPAGLIGVDIFFVISGFVVSASVLSQDFKGPRDLLSFFFSRRLKRIAPALSVCVLITAAATIAVIPKSYLSDTSLSSGLGAIFGVSNIVLFRASDGYFGTRAELNPFTHTWSLGVEEQFYLLFPLVTAALLLMRLGRRITLGVWMALTAASLLAAAYYTPRDQPMAFYLSPPRFWELGVGVVAYLVLPNLLPAIRKLRDPAISALAALALMGIGASLIWSKGWGEFPFPAVVPAVLSVALLLVLLVAHPTGAFAALLAKRPVVYVGRISYSLYLWHWPVFVLMRWTVGFSSPWQIAVGTVLAVVLAMLSYHWIEQPIRTGGWMRGRRAATIIAGLGFLLASGGAMALAMSRQDELTTSITRDRNVWHTEGTTHGLEANCSVSIKTTEQNGGIQMEFTPNGCKTPVAMRQLFVAGDSHVGSLIRVLLNTAAGGNYRVRMFSKPGCSVLALQQPQAALGAPCNDYAREVFELVRNEAAPGDALLLPSLRLTRLQAMDGTNLPAREILRDPKARQAAEAEAEALLQPLTDRGIHVVFDAPMPVFRIAAFRCSDWFNRMNPVCGEGFEIKRSEFDAQRSEVLASMRHLRDVLPRISIWDPSVEMCNDNTCTVLREGKPMFFDGDHLSGWGNDVIWPGFERHMNALPAPGSQIPQ